MMAIHVFGLDQTMSLVIVVSISCILLMLLSLIILVVFILVQKCRAKRRKHKQSPTDGLIPPIYYTDGMKDPLQQEDLYERIKEH